MNSTSTLTFENFQYRRQRLIEKEEEERGESLFVLYMLSFI